MNRRQAAIATPEGLGRYLALRDEAVAAVVGRFDGSHFGARGRVACAEDIGYHLEFLRPALEFGILQPFIDYVSWLAAVLGSRGLPADHLPRSLAWLGEFFEARLGGEDAAPVVVALDAARMALLLPDPAPPYERLMPKAWDECAAFQEALVRGDRGATTTIFRAAAGRGGGFLNAELHLVQPALYRIGAGWQGNRISVAQEHMASALVHGLLAREFATADPAAPDGRRVVLACVEGNQHFIGLRLLADAFEMSGWDVLYLGANTPTRSLVQLVRDTRPGLVGLSVTLPHHLDAAREAIAALRADSGEDGPALMLGGLAINQFTPLAGILGADATGQDAVAAVSVAATLVAA